MPSDRDALLSMGFDPARVEWALRATSNRGLQPAMDHIFEHEGQEIPSDQDKAPAASSSTAGAGGTMDVDEEEGGAGLGQDLEAKSIKCAECGKTFKNTALANFHAEKSGHDQFEESTEEIKPLTEEEKKQKLQELKEKMALKKARKEEEEAKEQKANEELRRKKGKDLGQIKEEMRVKEELREAERKKREKIEEVRAKAAIKAQIEADKRERVEKAAREKALREGKALPDASSSVSIAAPASGLVSTVAGRDFKETRLQIRMATGGQPYTTTLSSDATLREVAEFLAGQSLSVDVETVTLAQHFPRKAFTRADFSKTLRELGLTPSAVLIAS